MVSVVLATLLAPIALLHAYWARGGLWPGRDEGELISRVIGDARLRRLPPPFVIWIVASLILVSAVWALLLLPAGASLLPRYLRSGIGLALAAVFLVRGAAGYLPAWRRAHGLQPFARLDMRVYSPLCLLIGAGFGQLVLRSDS
jgi:hypothetical protein